MKIQHLALLFSLVAAGCGGGGGDSPAAAAPAAPAPAPAASSPPGGLYVGHYQEDAANNPENPMPGSFYLYLPEGDAAFSGAMSFTYIGCQSTNVGTVSGTKSGLALSGNWTGTVDNVPVGGPYTGTYDATAQRYSGTYQNSGGKVRVTVPNCIDYYVAAYGTWEMSPVAARSPADFVVSVGGGNVTWTDVAGVAQWLASVYDVAKTQSGSDAVVKQALITATSAASEQTVPLSMLGLTSGRQYVLAITAFNGQHQRVGYTSTTYTAP